MLHLFHQADEQHHNDGDEYVRHEEDNPASVVRVDVCDLEKHPRAEQVRVEEDKFDQQHHKDELQRALIVRLDSDLLQLLVNPRHEMKPHNEFVSLDETVEEHGADANQSDAQL